MRDEAAVAIVLAAEGYPGDPRRGDAIEGIDDALAPGALVFHAGTVARQRPEGGFGTNGGRVLAVSAWARTSRPPAPPPSAPPTPSPGPGCSAGTTSPPSLPDRPAVLASGRAAPRVPEPAR